MAPKVVIDTNVLVSALRSRRGASFQLLSLVGTGVFEISLSVPLVFEYEDAARRMTTDMGLTAADIDDLLDYLCRVADRRQIHFLWRPTLRDPGDDMILELAVEAECDYIVTFNKRDFAGSEKFAVQVVTPQELLRILDASGDET